MTSLPTVSDLISLSPSPSSRRTIPETMRSTRSGSTGRLRRAICMERISLSRSNGTRLPERFNTCNSRSCTRSNVVKRPPQSGQNLRRLIAAPSSLGLLSFTWVSPLPQYGQRIETPCDLAVYRKPIRKLCHPTLDGVFHASIALFPIIRKSVENLHDELARFNEFGDSEA